MPYLMIDSFGSANPVFEANGRIPLKLVRLPSDLLHAHGPVAELVQRIVGGIHSVGVRLFNGSLMKRVGPKADR